MEGGDPTQIQNFIDLVPLPPNLACSMTSVAQTPSSAFKTNSLSRMDDLERSLSRCDEPSYTENYYNDLAKLNPYMLYERYKGLKKRMEWLASEETTEFTRVAALNVLNQAQLLPGYSSTPPPTSFEADAFLQNVFGGPETQPTTLELNPQNHQNITPEQQFVIGGADSFPSALEQHQLLRSGITPFTERAPIPNYLADGDVEDGLKGAKPSKLTRQTILGAKRKQEDII